MKRTLFACLALLSLSLPAWAQSSEVERARALAQKGRRGEAIELLPKVIADKIAERDPSLVVQIKKTSAEVDADDPYAAFQVPDDLMW